MSAKTRIPRCLAMQERARRAIPGMCQLLSKRPDMYSLGVWPGYFDRAAGSRVWDLDGNEYVDMSIGGIGANVLGYADPDVDAAVLEAVRKGTSASLNCPEEVLLAERLIALHPWAEMARFTRSGGEAMAVAVRIARAATGRGTLAFCGYHGWHDWYLSANLGRDGLDGHLLAGLEPAGVPRGLAGTARPFRFNRLDELQAIADDVPEGLAAIVLEPIRNFRPDPAFVRGVRALADRIGAVLIFDEISAGFRFACGGSHLALFPERPDICVLSKALGNGYAISAVLGTRATMQAAQKTFISSTAWTERVGFAAALACVDKHARLDVPALLDAAGRKVMAGWAAAAKRNGLEITVGGMPPIAHFEFADPRHDELKAYFIQLMLERGFLASTLYYAMTTHGADDLDGYLAATDECFGLLARALAGGDLAARLEGRPAAHGFTRLN
jgi:glutamate-1-semialdehyde 2,1-aminomutase